MSTHDSHPIDQADEQTDALHAEASCEQALPEDGEPTFRISVRKVQAKVQCRGVLAE
jgi:hypothetical protein